MTKDWELLRQLEYQGEYGCRYTCKDCKFYCHQGDAELGYGTCAMLSDYRIKISGKNNICKNFEARIKNPSSPDFNFDDYLEFLYTEFYRAYTINKDEIRGSAKLGEVILDGGKLAEMFPNTYSYFYEYYDLPYCKVNLKTCHVKTGIHNFEVDYRLYRKCKWYENNIIKYIKHYWKDKPTQRKYHSEIYGEYEVKEK